MRIKILVPYPNHLRYPKDSPLCSPPPEIAEIVVSGGKCILLSKVRPESQSALESATERVARLMQRYL